MDRRRFIKNSGKGSLGLFLAPTFLLNSCTNAEFQMDNWTYDGKVIIVGAGAAGLFAARLLERNNIDYVLLEANSEIGGRLGANTDFADFPIDTGAQWLHGNRSFLATNFQEQGVPFSKDNSDSKYWFQNEMVDQLPKNPQPIFSGNDMPDLDFLSYAHQEGFGAEYDLIVEAIAGDQGADSSELSAYWNNKEEENWSSGNSDYKFSKTYFDAVTDLYGTIPSSKLFLQAPVSSIDYQSDSIRVQTSNGIDILCSKVLITVPIPVLQDGDIDFLPALPSEKITAFSKIGMGPGMKVFLKFSQKFYDDGIMGGSTCAAYLNERTGKSGNDNVLLAFLMGHQASNLSLLGSDELIIEKLLEELDGMYNQNATQYFEKGIVVDWTKNPYVKGAYSYAKVGIGNARQIAAAPVENRIYFAGEAMNLSGHHQTVHGAIESAHTELTKFLKTK